MLPLGPGRSVGPGAGGSCRPVRGSPRPAGTAAARAGWSPPAPGERKWESELRLPETALLRLKTAHSGPDPRRRLPPGGARGLQRRAGLREELHTHCAPRGDTQELNRREAGFPALPPKPTPLGPQGRHSPGSAGVGALGYCAPRPSPPRPAVAGATPGRASPESWRRPG